MLDRLKTDPSTNAAASALPSLSVARPFLVMKVFHSCWSFSMRSLTGPSTVSLSPSPIVTVFLPLPGTATSVSNGSLIASDRAFAAFLSSRPCGMLTAIDAPGPLIGTLADTAPEPFNLIAALSAFASSSLSLPMMSSKLLCHSVSTLYGSSSLFCSVSTRSSKKASTPLM